jgi:hypothetical protein
LAPNARRQASIIILDKAFFADSFSDDDRAAILAHEFAHCNYYEQKEVASPLGTKGEIAVDAIVKDWDMGKLLIKYLHGMLCRCLTAEQEKETEERINALEKGGAI